MIFIRHNDTIIFIYEYIYSIYIYENEYLKVNDIIVANNKLKNNYLEGIV